MKQFYINKSIESCKDCPFCEYNRDYGLSYDSGYDCMHEKSPEIRIIDDSAIVDGLVPFPIWCPLEDATQDSSEVNNESNEIALAKAILEFHVHTQYDWNAGTADHTCYFCDSNYVTVANWEKDMTLNAIMAKIKHQENCPVLLAKKTIHKELQRSNNVSNQGSFEGERK